MTDNPLPVCSVCEHQIFSVDNTCGCDTHDNQTIAISLRHVAAVMERMSDVMRARSGISETDLLLLQHSGEMQGASRMCIQWAEFLENET